MPSQCQIVAHCFVDRCINRLQAVEYDMERADEADKSGELHGSEREEPESTTRTRQKASKAVEKVPYKRLDLPDRCLAGARTEPGPPLVSVSFDRQWQR